MPPEHRAPPLAPNRETHRPIPLAAKVITDESTQWSLAEARKRGVRIRMLVEGDRTDAKPVKYASRADYETLLERGSSSPSISRR